MKHLEKLNRKKLGEILIDEGLISKNQLRDAERHREKTGEPLGYVLVDCSYLPEEDLARSVALHYQLPYVELSTIPPGPDVDELIPIRDVVTLRLLPVARFGSVVTIAVAEMPDLAVLKDLRQRTGLTPFLCVSMLGEIDRHITTLMELKGFSRDVVLPPEAPDETESVLESVLGGNERLDKDEFSDKGRTITIEAPNIDEGDWENLFDEANDEVLKELTD